MKRKIKEWLDLNAKRLIELKLLGGYEIFRGNINNAMAKLTKGELCEFLILSGQLDLLVWIFESKNEDQVTFMSEEIYQYLTKVEKQAMLIRKKTKLKRLPKGEA